MSDISTSYEIVEIRDLLNTYVDGGLDEEQLIERLAQMRDIESDGPKDPLAIQLSELVGRIDMIRLNVCRAERRHAIAEVLADFKRRHLEAAT